MAELTEAQLYDLGNAGHHNDKVIKEIMARIVELQKELAALQRALNNHIKAEKKKVK